MVDLAPILETAAVCLKRIYSELSAENEIAIAAATCGKLRVNKAAARASLGERIY